MKGVVKVARDEEGLIGRLIGRLIERVRGFPIKQCGYLQLADSCLI